MGSDCTRSLQERQGQGTDSHKERIVGKREPGRKPVKGRVAGNTPRNAPMRQVSLSWTHSTVLLR
jgi:hypothetical protein